MGKGLRQEHGSLPRVYIKKVSPSNRWLLTSPREDWGLLPLYILIFISIL